MEAVVLVPGLVEGVVEARDSVSGIVEHLPLRQ